MLTRVPCKQVVLLFKQGIVHGSGPDDEHVSGARWAEPTPNCQAGFAVDESPGPGASV